MRPGCWHPRCSPPWSSPRPSPGPDGLAVDERSLGLAAAVVALLLRAPMLVVIVAAAATTALARLIL